MELFVAGPAAGLFETENGDEVPGKEVEWLSLVPRMLPSNIEFELIEDVGVPRAWRGAI